MFRYSRLLATVAILILPGAVYAQTPGDFTKTAPVPPSQVRPAQGLTPLFTFGNTNIVIDAPVQAPGDSRLAYRTFEGSPMTGKDALIAPPQILPPSPG